MIDGNKYVEIVNDYFEFLIIEYDFKRNQNKLRGNVFYEVSYHNKNVAISISYENIENYFLVIIFLLQNGELPNYDDKTRTIHLNKFSEMVLPKINKDEFLLNQQFFIKFCVKTKLEKLLLKSAKELRLCLKYIDRIQDLNAE